MTRWNPELWPDDETSEPMHAQGDRKQRARAARWDQRHPVVDGRMPAAQRRPSPLAPESWREPDWSLASAGWRLVITEDDETHHVPDEDLVQHVARGDCVCGPQFCRVMDGDEELWLTLHHALDGRAR